MLEYQSMDQIYMFENYSYLIGPYKKKIKKTTNQKCKYESTLNTISERLDTKITLTGLTCS